MTRRRLRRYRPRALSDHAREQIGCAIVVLFLAAMIAICVRFPAGFVVWRGDHLSLEER